MKKTTTKTAKILMALAVICVTTLSANAKGGWGTRVRNDGHVSSRPERNLLGPSYGKLKMINDTNTSTRFFYRWDEKEGWRALTGSVSSGCSDIKKLRIPRGQAVIFLKAECGSGSITTSFVATADRTNWWRIK